jgi:hypothetical protein
VTDVRCPKCAAHVAATATWCGQCYTSLVVEPVKPARQPLRAPAALQVVGGSTTGSVALLADVPPPPPGTIPPPPGTIPPPPAPPAAGPGQLKLGKQPWPCVRCETVNAYEHNTCSACGMGFLDALTEPMPSLPLIGSIDASTWSGKLKIGLIGFTPLVLLILILFTIAGFVLK